MCSDSWFCCFLRPVDAASLQGTGVPCQVESQCHCWGNSIKLLEAGVGGFSDALPGLRRCRLTWVPMTAPKYGSKEGKVEKRRKGPKWKLS